MKVLCFGSLNIDYTYKVDHFVKKGETLAAKEMKIYSGGKGMNQAVALSKAGSETYMAGNIGKDGMFLLDELKKANVNTSCVQVLDNEQTGHAIIQNDPEGDNCIMIYGGANRKITQSHIDLVLTHFDKNDFIVLQNEINEIEYIMEKAYQKGMRIVFNPSPIDERIKNYPLNKVTYLLLNEVEASALTNSDITSHEELYQQLSSKYPQTQIILTLGKDGSLYKENDEIKHQNIYKVKAVDTTAAGDTFTGYFVSSLVHHRSLSEAMDIASRASAIAVTRAGATPSIPTEKEVKEYIF